MVRATVFALSPGYPVGIGRATEPIYLTHLHRWELRRIKWWKSAIVPRKLIRLKNDGLKLGRQWFDHIVFDGEADGGHPGRRPELVIDAAEMRVDGARAQEEALSHPGVGHAGGDQLQHFGLPGA